jgi:hypothetical protein
MRRELSSRDIYFRTALKNLASIYEKEGRKPEARVLLRELVGDIKLHPPAPSAAVVRAAPPPNAAPPQVAVAPRPEVKAEVKMDAAGDVPQPASAAPVILELHSLPAPDAAGSWLPPRRRR